MATHSYQDLISWQKAMLLVEAAYKLTKFLPSEEKFALSDQIRRSAVSIPSNIAEGQKRLGKAEMMHFVGIALGSLGELETQLLLSQRLYGINAFHEIELCSEVGKLLSGLLKSLRTPN